MALTVVGACAIPAEPQGSNDFTAAGRDAPITAPLVIDTRVRALDGTVPTAGEISQTATFLAAPGAQTEGDIAGGDGVFLAVWQDERDGAPAIYGARIDASNNVLDPGGIAIAPAPAFSPRVAYNGSTFVVAWSTGSTIVAAEVSPSLPTQSAVAKRKVLKSGMAHAVSGLAAAPGHFLTVIHSPQFSFEPVEALLVNSSGVVEIPFPEPEVRVLAKSTVGVAYCGGQYRLALPLYVDNPGGMLFRRVDPMTGAVNSWVTPPTHAKTPYNTSLACTATSSLVVWEELNITQPGQATDLATIHAEFLDGPLEQHVLLSDGGKNSSRPAIAPNGDDYVVAWTTSDGAASSAVTTTVSGATGSPSPLRTAAQVTDVRVATDAKASNSPLFAFNVEAQGGTDMDDIVGASNTQFGSASWPIATRPNEQRFVRLAQSLNGPIAAWIDFSAGPESGLPMVARLNDQGQVTTTPTMIDIYADVVGFKAVDLAFATAKQRWLAVWSGISEGHTDDVLLAASGGGTNTIVEFVITGGYGLSPRNPAVVLSGTYYVVAELGSTLCKGTCTFTGSKLLLRRIAVNTESAPDPPLIDVVGGAAHDPALAATQAGGVVVVWETDGDIFGAPVTATDTTLVLPANPLASLPGKQRTPAIAFRPDGTEGLVVWQDESNSGKRIVASRIDASAKLVGNQVMVSGTLASSHPTVIVDGDKYLIAWEGSEAGATPQLYGAAVRFDGSLADPVPHLLSKPLFDAQFSTEASPALDPRMHRLPSGRVLLTNQQVVPRLGVTRVVSTVLAPEAKVGDTCTSSFDCDGRFCVDGVCCATACDGACERCDGRDTEASPEASEAPGTCRLVSGGADDHCGGEHACGSEGSCLLAAGQSCTKGEECATGHCALGTKVAGSDAPVQGVCCERACDGSCESCGEPGLEGKCITLSCGGFACTPRADGTDRKQCRATCTDSNQCAVGNQCVGDRCVTPPAITPIDSGCAVTKDARTSGIDGTLVMLLGAIAALRTRRTSRQS